MAYGNFWQERECNVHIADMARIILRSRGECMLNESDDKENLKESKLLLRNYNKKDFWGYVFLANGSRAE